MFVFLDVQIQGWVSSLLLVSNEEASGSGSSYISSQRPGREDAKWAPWWPISNFTHQKPQGMSIGLSKASTLQTKTAYREFLETVFIFDNRNNFQSCCLKFLRHIVFFFKFLSNSYLSFVILSRIFLFSLLARTESTSLKSQATVNLSLLFLCCLTKNVT